MVYLEIDKNNVNLVDTLNQYLQDKQNKVFVLYYMDGCPACEIAKPEWQKLKNVLPANQLDQKDIVVALVNHLIADQLKVGKPPSAFPTMRFITKRGNIIESYEDPPHLANHQPAWKTDRSIDSFVDWIQHHVHHRPNSNSMTKKRIRMYQGGRKWSRKYKRSIRCRRPKGFSQKQYCKYGRKKRRT